MFYSALQRPSGHMWLVVHSQHGAEETAAALRETLRGLNPGLPVRIKSWDRELAWVLFPAARKNHFTPYRSVSRLKTPNGMSLSRRRLRR
jgi:hypothetical protein